MHHLTMAKSGRQTASISREELGNGADTGLIGAPRTGRAYPSLRESEMRRLSRLASGPPAASSATTASNS